MVALIWDGNGDICGIHRTYLNFDGTKADIKPVRRPSAASRAAPSALALPSGRSWSARVGDRRQRRGNARLPAWSAIACGNLRAAMVLPEILRTVVIAADHDGRGRQAAAGAARRWRADGRTVRIFQPDRPRIDFNDLYRARLEAIHAG